MYWCTGIKIERQGDLWCVKLSFYDSGFCQDDCTEGELRVRYLVPGLGRAIDTLLREAQALGIEFRDPTIYYLQDGELEDGDHPELREVANREATRIGWQPAYTLTVSRH